MSDRIVVLVTVETAEVAERIATAVVAERLAACANLVPGLTSIYSWQGKLERATEQLMLIKTRTELFDQLRARVIALHPYEVPEVIALPIVAGHAPYLAWIDANTVA